MKEKPKRRPVPLKMRFLVFERDGFRCRYCGRGSDEVVLHCDHVDPVAAGGDTVEDNLVTACQDCNLGKGKIAGVASPPARGAKTSPAPTKPKPVADPPAPVRIQFYGHEFKLHEPSGEWLIHRQFELIERGPNGKYIAELYSWWSGDPNGTVTIPGAELIPPRFIIYGSYEEWLEAAAAASTYADVVRERHRESAPC